ncbi:zinc finger protein Xfin-like [Mytilus edulis]|uniref:zinc finger protein Xfin-like n=1 Tax=Mytilus edulis TaxID=6550 RepID=UPI0039F0320B
MAFTQCSSRNHHHRLHTGEKPYKCKECGASFVQSGSLTNHMIKHTNERNYKCDECLSMFKSRKTLLRHKKIHNPTRDYQCQFCWREYRQKYYFKQHSKVCKLKDNQDVKYDLEKFKVVTENEFGKIDTDKNEDIQEPPLSQDLNDEEMLQDNQDLNDEEMLQDNQDSLKTQDSSKTQDKNEKTSKNLLKPFLCSICGKQFTSKGNLKHHFITHNCTGAFLCEVCGKRFHHQPSLDNHVRIQHKGESPYQCSICKKMYTSSASLNNHFRVHFDDRPFACKICKKSFKVKGALIRHMNIHVQDSPLTNCEFCGKPSVDRSAKITHYKLHFHRLFQKAEVKKTNTESDTDQIQILHSILKNNRGLIKNPKCENNPCKLTYKEQWNKWQESMFKEIVEVLGAEKRKFDTPVKLKDIPKIGIIQKDVYIEKQIMKRPSKKIKINHKRTEEVVSDEKHAEGSNHSGCHDNNAINEFEKITSNNSDMSENSLIEKNDCVMKKDLSEKSLTMYIKQEADENKTASSVNINECPLSENLSIENRSKGDNPLKFEIYDFIKKINETTLQIKDDKAVNPILEFSNNISKNCFETNEENVSENVETFIMGDNSSKLKVSDIGSRKVDRSLEMTNDGTHSDNFPKDVESVEHNSDMNFSNMEGLSDYSQMGENSCHACVSIEENNTAELEKQENMYMLSSVTDQQGNEIDATNRDNKNTGTSQGKKENMYMLSSVTDQQGNEIDATNRDNKNTGTSQGKKENMYMLSSVTDQQENEIDNTNRDNKNTGTSQGEKENMYMLSSVTDQQGNEIDNTNRDNKNTGTSQGEKENMYMLSSVTDQQGNEIDNTNRDNKNTCTSQGNTSELIQNSLKVMRVNLTKMGKHSGIAKSYFCSECDKGFYLKRMLDKHEAKCQKDDEEKEKHFCHICDKEFSSRSGKMRHIETVHPFDGVKKYACHFCGQRFSQNSSKVLHMIRVHQNEKRYKCSVCKIHFNILADLKNHQKKHTSRIQKFSCQLCDGLFNRKSDYDYHVGRVHPMSRPYRCGGCMKGFKTAKEVRNHGQIDRCKTATPKILKLVVVDETDDSIPDDN